MFCLSRSTIPIIKSTPTIRTFTTSDVLCWRSHANHLALRHANVPEYPYGSAQWYKQSDKGLYGGQMIRFGNNVGEKSQMKTRRAWHPNVITRNLRSTLMNRIVRIKLTTRVLRTIDKVGGLDAYLLGPKPARIKELGLEGWKLRCELLELAKHIPMKRDRIAAAPLSTTETAQEGSVDLTAETASLETKDL